MRIEENRLLAPLTTLGIGGPARWFATVQREGDIPAALAWASERDVPLFVLGGGSNLLVSDAGFNGLVLQIELKGIRAREVGTSERIYEVAAGEDWDGFVQRAVDDDCAGIECLAGIPGTAGGTPVQNVGAYGQEVASTIEQVGVLNVREGAFETLSGPQCCFGYRRSIFNSRQDKPYIVTRVDYRLRIGGQPELKYDELKRALRADGAGNSSRRLRDVAATVRRIRQSKGMLLVEGDEDCRSAGSFFKNPAVSQNQAARVASAAGSEPPRFPAGPDHPGLIKLPAAWLIERAGFAKGYSLGRAGISHKHTLALVNRGGATAAEVLALANKIKSAVAERFAIELQMEPVLLGFEKSEPTA